jgi:hypothetical protein
MFIASALATWCFVPEAHAGAILSRPLYLGLDQGLVGYWSFEGKTVSGIRVFDASGNGNYGTMTNGPTLVNGKLGQAMQFDGRDDYVDAGDPADGDLDFGTADFSGSFWLKTTANNSLYIISKRASCGSVAMWNTGLNSDGSVFFELANTDQQVSSVKSVNDNNWHHVSFVRIGAVKYLYIDGVLDSSAVGPNTPDVSNASTLTIGKGICPGTYGGLIDDVRIYNRALSADEIKRLYNRH